MATCLQLGDSQVARPTIKILKALELTVVGRSLRLMLLMIEGVAGASKCREDEGLGVVRKVMRSAKVEEVRRVEEVKEMMREIVRVLEGPIP